MFEKEAEEYLKKLLKRLKIKEKDLAENQPKIQSWEKMNFISLNVSNVSKAFQDGAEFGYNKANEWHYVKDGDLPKATTPVLVILESGVPYVSWISSDKGWWFCTNYYTGEDKVIAWKEIVVPKESE